MKLSIDHIYSNFSQKDNFLVTLLVSFIILCVIIRFFPILFNGYTFGGNGGLLTIVTSQIIDGNFSLPEKVNYYNGGSLPFSYPPLAFYLVAFVKYLFPLDILTIQSTLPVLLFCFSAAIFYRALVGIFSIQSSLLAVFVLSVSPSVLLQLGNGFGSVRSLSFMFYIVCILGLLKYDISKNPWILGAISGFSTSLAVMSHPVIGYCTLLTSFLSLLYYSFGKDKELIYKCFLSYILSGILLSAPYISYVIYYGLIDNYLNALGSRTHTSAVLSSLFFEVTAERHLTIWNVFAIFGLIISASMRKWVLFICLAIGVYVPIRAAAVPSLAILCAVAYSKFRSNNYEKIHLGVLNTSLSLYATFLVLGIIYSTASLSTTVMPKRIAGSFGGLDERIVVDESLIDASKWAERNISTHSSVFYVGSLNEWAPALSHRKSILTHQGAEWTDRYFDIKSNRKKLESEKCISNMYSKIKNMELKANYVFSPKHKIGVCVNKKSDKYSKVFENSGIIVFRLNLQ